MKKFAGFTPQQQYTLLSKQGYTGPADEASMAKFLAASPSAASKMGEYAQIAQQRLAGKPMPSQGMFLGGVVGALSTTANKTVTPMPKLPATPADPMQKLAQASVTDPTSIVQTPEVAQITPTEGTEVTEGTGQMEPTAVATPTTVIETATAQAPETQQAATFDASTVSDGVQEALSGVQAATGAPTEAATVRGQLTELMKDFENDGTPPWASGAMRNAMAQMQARGLGASSIAGMAITQAAMESAISIASQDASTNAQFELQNLNNEQQTMIFKTQQKIAGLFSDQASQNAAKQFNAASENQTQQFFAGLQSTVSQFNAAQVNAVRQFNAGETNALEQFNKQQENLRTQFNAQNALVIAQANAQWRQNIETVNTATQNQANMEAAKVANGYTQTTIDQIWQRERDIMAAALTTAEGDANRNVSLLLGQLDAKTLKDAQKARDNASKWQLAANLLFG